MNIIEIKQYLEENKETPEVKEFVNGFRTLEVFKDLVTSDSNFTSYMDSERDRHSSKALETWKSNNLEKLVNDKVKELYPEEDEKDSEIRTMKQQIEQMQRDTTRKELTNFALKQATEKKLPVGIIDHLIGLDEETTLANLDKFEQIFSETVESQLKAKLQGNGDVVPKSNGTLGSGEETLGQRLAKKTVESNTISQEQKDIYFK